MSEHIEKIEKECEKTEEKYTSQIRALKDEKKQEKEKESQQQGNVMVDTLKQQLYALEQERQQLEYKVQEYLKAYNKISEELEITRSQASAEKVEKEALEKQCQLLEEKLKNCQQCERLVQEKQELLKEKEEKNEEIELVKTQMKYFEEDFKHERKDREDMKNKYDQQLTEFEDKVKLFSLENRRLRQQNQEMGSHHRMNAFQPHHFEDTTTDNVPYSSCAYGQAHHGYMSNPWGGQHSMLPSEVVVDGPDEKVEASLGSHIARECPRCEREFAAHQREDFEKHVEKCLFTN